jgi:IS4 transposase
VVRQAHHPEFIEGRTGVQPSSVPKISYAFQQVSENFISNVPHYPYNMWLFKPYYGGGNMAHLKKGFIEFYSYNNMWRLLSFIPKGTLNALIEKYQADKWVHTLFTFNLIKLYILMHLLKPKLTSLRAIVRFSANYLFKSFTGLTSLSRNGLSKANRDLDYLLFAELLDHLLIRAKRNIKRKLNRIKIFDTTFIMLSLKLFPAAARCSGKGCVKLGLRIDLGQTLPDKVVIEIKNTNDNTLFQKMIDFASSGVTYLFDRGFFTIQVLDQIHDTKNFFITRKHSCYRCRPLKNFKLKRTNTQDLQILKDQLVQIGARENKAKNKFRLVTAKTNEGEILLFLTNRFDLSPLDICELYTLRWEIETLFKWLKQYLKINQFISRSLNGVMSQIYIALIFQTLLNLYHNQNQRRFDPSSKLKLSLLETMCHLENQIINEILCFFFQQGFLLRASRLSPVTSCRRISSLTLKSWGH